MSKKERIKELITILNKASKEYYQGTTEIMSNFEYDRLYDELLALEKETGIIYSNSPTVNVGYEIVSSLPKEKHEQRMLSLDKTKDIDEIEKWISDKEGVLSWKLDGLTIVLTYENGKLSKAVTRGNGEIGEVITQNVLAFTNIPREIPYKNKTTLRGEAVISYEDFEKINKTILESEEKFKNPRNLCSGTVRQLNPKIVAERNVRFYAFALIDAHGMKFNTRKDQFSFLSEQNFDVVDYTIVNQKTIRDEILAFTERLKSYDIPCDGLVLSYNDLNYSKSLGETSKFPRDSIAFKWEDETKETKITNVEWLTSRTGRINPVAVFEPLEIAGSTISKATMHNLSILKKLKIGIGDTVTVYKSNMIIPAIAENLTESDNLIIPTTCPVCGFKTEVKKENQSEVLYCANKNCEAKNLKKFTHFVSRNAMNIEGLSEATLEKFIANGFIKEFSDIYNLSRFKEKIISIDGFGEKSYNNLINSIEKSKVVEPSAFLFALGIPNLGLVNAKSISEHCKNKWDNISKLTKEELLKIDGIGNIIADSFIEFLNQTENKSIIHNLLKHIHFSETFTEKSALFKGLSFVITGTLINYENRDELKTLIENLGGKVINSVSKNTNYLINNDSKSTSSKNKKAQELGIKIIEENVIKKWIDDNQIS